MNVFKTSPPDVDIGRRRLLANGAKAFAALAIGESVFGCAARLMIDTGKNIMEGVGRGSPDRLEKICELENTPVLDRNGKKMPVGLVDLLNSLGKEKPALLSFGSYSCHSCVEELELLQRISNQADGRLSVVPIFMLHPENLTESVGETQRVMAEKMVRLPWITMFEADMLEVLYGQRRPSSSSLPHNLLVSKTLDNGKRNVLYHVGAVYYNGKADERFINAVVQLMRE